MAEARANGTTLHYESDGEGEIPVVFAHGGEGTHLHWWHQVGALRSEFRCVTYDARGFGQSGGRGDVSSPEIHTADLIGLLGALGGGPAVLVGHSMGGSAVGRAAIERPDLVAGVVCSGSPFGFATAALGRWAGEMVEKLAVGFDVSAHFFAPGFEEAHPETAFLYRALSRLNPPRTGPRGVNVYETWREQAPADYGAFPVPSLFVVGSEDGLTFPWLMRATADAVGGARFVEIPGSGHSIYAEQPTAFEGVLRDFLREVAATA